MKEKKSENKEYFVDMACVNSGIANLKNKISFDPLIHSSFIIKQL